jgi:hypothetical protein
MAHAMVEYARQKLVKWAEAAGRAGDGGEAAQEADIVGASLSQVREMSVQVIPSVGYRDDCGMVDDQPC